jgi:biotin operon repressor
MPYERSQALEKRLQDLLGLLRKGRHSAPPLARELDVSRPTAGRCVAALRERGFIIRVLKDREGWSYRLSSEVLTVEHTRGLP